MEKIHVQPDGTMYQLVNDERLKELFSAGTHDLVEIHDDMEIGMLEDKERMEMALGEEYKKGYEIGDIMDIPLESLKFAVFIKTRGFEKMTKGYEESYIYSSMYDLYFLKNSIEADYSPEEESMLELIEYHNEED